MNREKLSKLNVTDTLEMGTGHKYPLRLREDLNDWIKENTTGSYNSVLNFLINIGINNVAGILEHDSLYQTIRSKEDDEPLEDDND